jgi:PadR family transcriptional regulator PadR
MSGHTERRRDVAGSDLYMGTLDTLILKAVSWGPRHGYAIGRWIREQTDGVLQVKEGALYPALHRLEKKDWLDERWGTTDTGREAKYYTLTTEGRGKLKSEISRWSQYTAAVSAALSASPAEEPAG